MSWPQASGLGGMGMGAGNLGGAAVMESQTANIPQGTEYTLQGVMRFLQTEWHRHERDRNAWEIERQEMKARIAALEGQGRRADKLQRSLRRYVLILEQTLEQERKKRVNGTAEPLKIDKDVADSTDFKRFEGDVSFDKMEPERSQLKQYLDQCSGEFTYLMVSPSNPQPPREPPPSPPNPEDVGLAPGYDIPHGQLGDEYYQQQARAKNPGVVAARPAPTTNHQQPSAVSQPRNPEAVTAPMVRSLAEQPNQQVSQSDWSASFQLADQAADENVIKINHSYNSHGRPIENEPALVKSAATDVGAWDFSEGVVPDADPKPVTSRPDTDAFPAAQEVPKSPNRGAPGSHRRRSSGARRKSLDNELGLGVQKTDGVAFKVRFGFRGHLDTVRAVLFTGGGSPGEPEICTAGDDGTIKRWIIPARYESHGGVHNSDLDVQSYFTHRGHTGSVTCLAAWCPAQNFSSGGRAQGDGWIFSGGQDASVRVWERGRVDPKATLEGHTDAVWAICVLPATCGAVFGPSNAFGGAERLLLVSGAADGSVKLWSVSMPPQLASPPMGTGRRGGGGRVRGNSMSSGSGFPSSPQPSIASNSPFHYTLIHTIQRSNSTASPTSITPLSPTGETFVVAYADATVLVYDTRTGEEIVGMLSQETYDGTASTGVNAIVASTTGLEGSLTDAARGVESEDTVVHGATGSSAGTEGVIISGHEDRYIRFYDANSGQCTYNMLAHPAAISSLSLSPDGRELVSGGHDASLRFWSLEKRSCTQEITSHRLMRGEGVCSVVWSQDGRWVVSAGGDGVVKVFAR